MVMTKKNHIFGVNSKNCQKFELSYHSFQTTKLEKKNHNNNTERKHRRSIPSRKVKKTKKQKQRHCASDKSSRSLYLTSWKVAIKIAKSKTNKCQDLKIKCRPMFNSPHMLGLQLHALLQEKPMNQIHTNHIFQATQCV